MSLVLSSEVVVERFLPTARSMLARALDERGFTQQEVAARFGVTQAAVSQYVRGDVTVEERFAEDERMRATVERIADGFAAESMDGYEALAELLALVESFEDRGPICAVHEAEMPALEGMSCDLCVRGSDDAVIAEREALSVVRRAARRLASAPGMATHVPNVGTAVPDAADVTDVAAVPGRLQAVGSRVLVPADPEFGASQRVATTILAVMATGSGLRGALNLATSDALLETARERLRDRFRERGSSTTRARSASSPSRTSSARRRPRPRRWPSTSPETPGSGDTVGHK